MVVSLGFLEVVVKLLWPGVWAFLLMGLQSFGEFDTIQIYLVLNLRYGLFSLCRREELPRLQNESKERD